MKRHVRATRPGASQQTAADQRSAAPRGGSGEQGSTVGSSRVMLN